MITAHPLCTALRTPPGTTLAPQEVPLRRPRDPARKMSPPLLQHARIHMTFFHVSTFLLSLPFYSLK